MQRWKTTLAYDGTTYHGWQVQPDRSTVQGVLAQCIRHITGELTLPQGSGRTDSGVHALAQVAHFDLTCSIPPQNLHRALNRSLPPSIRILSLSHCSPDFHARHSALRKTYEYRILARSPHAETVCPPFLAPYLWTCPCPLAIDLLNQAATHVIGTHDFTSFAAVNPDQATRNARLEESETTQRSPGPEKDRALKVGRDGDWSTSSAQTPPGCDEVTESAYGPLLGKPRNNRAIYASSWALDGHHDPPILRYRVTGSGFLHHMVRNLVGTFVECGASRLHPGQIPHILSRKNRQAAGPTAPPQGLFLAEVLY